MALSNFNQQLTNYRPTKATWFWSTVAAMGGVIILGFTWGGWVTGGTAKAMAADAAKGARAQVTSAICVDRFMTASDAGPKLAALMEESSYRRGNFVVAGGWAKLPTDVISENDVARACAEHLATMKLPVESAKVE